MSGSLLSVTSTTNLSEFDIVGFIPPKSGLRSGPSPNSINSLGRQARAAVFLLVGIFVTVCFAAGITKVIASLPRVIKDFTAVVENNAYFHV